MRSVADALRSPTGRSGGEPAYARIELALRLGDAAVALRGAATGHPEEVTRRELQRSAVRGRRPSRCAER